MENKTHYLTKNSHLFPKSIHHTGDIKLPNGSTNNQTDVALSFETNTTIDNDNDYNYEDET